MSVEHPRRWQAVAWSIAGVSWLLAIASLALVAVTAHVPASLADWVMDVVVAAVYGGLVVMLLPHTRHPVVWLLAAAGWGCGIAAFADGYVALDSAWPLQGLAFYSMWWAWIPGVYACVAVLPLLVVEGRSVWRRVALVVAAVAIGLSILPGMTLVAPGLPPNPLGIGAESWQQLLRHLASWPDRTVLALGAVECLWLAALVRRGPRDRRAGLDWLLAGEVAMVLSLATYYVPLPAAFADALPAVSGTALLVAQLFLPAALLVLVLGRQLWGVSLTVSRGTTWMIMTVTVALCYLAAVGLAARLVPARSDLVLAVAVGLVGLGSSPLRALVQRRVDRLVYGTGTDPARLWSSLEGPGADDLEALGTALSSSLRLQRVRIVPTDAGEVPGAADAEATTVPVFSHGRPVGVLLATPRPGERLDARTVGMLEGVAGLVGMTLDLSQANEALTAARSRMGSVRLEERRLLRRDLHDGLGPALAGIRLGLVAARNVRAHDPERAEQMLDDVLQELSRQGEDVRRLSRSILPLALDEGDLGAALRDLAARFGDDELTVRVTLTDDLDLSPEAQVAVYHIASEALLNARRHAGARHCDLVLRRRHDGGLLLVVSDDGAGIAPDAQEGIGLRSMRERASELGGSVEVAAAAGSGSRVTLRLPGIDA